MTDTDDAWVQLVTRVPQQLHRAAKLHAIATDQTLTALIVAALRERLAAAAESAA